MTIMQSETVPFIITVYFFKVITYFRIYFTQMHIYARHLIASPLPLFGQIECRIDLKWTSRNSPMHGYIFESHFLQVGSIANPK